MRSQAAVAHDNSLCMPCRQPPLHLLIQLLCIFSKYFIPITRSSDTPLFANKNGEAETDAVVKISSEEPSAQLTATLPFTTKVIVFYHFE